MYSIDRLGRSLVDLVACMDVCRARGVGLYLHEQNLDTATSNGLSLFDFAGMMTLHLRQSRRDTNSPWSGCGTCSISSLWPPSNPGRQGREKAKQGLAAGKGVRQVARLAGISAASVSRIKSASASSISSPQ